MKKSRKSWRDVLPVHPAAELFPLMSPDELKSLGEDIKKNGLRSPIVLWKDQKHFSPVLLDGRNRLDAMEAAGLAVNIKSIGTCTDPQIRFWVKPSRGQMPIYVETREVRGDHQSGDPYAYVLSANIHRRHLTSEQKRDLIAKLVKAQPEKSDRQIAKTTKVDHKTVGTVRAEMEGRGEIPHVETRADTRGRQQPANKPKPPTTKSPARDDIGPTSTGEIERLQALVEELQATVRLRDIKIVGLESEIAELKAEIERLRRKPEQADDGLDIPDYLRRAPATKEAAP